MNTTTADATAATFALPESVGLTLSDAPLQGAALNPTPGWFDVLREQFAAVGLALRREGVILGSCAALFTAFVGWMQLQHGSGEIPLSPKEGMAAALMALLIPMAVWKGEDPSRRGYHHAMPVDHVSHATARSAAGLAWTLAGVAAFFGWMALLSGITGGVVEANQTWQWIAPFTGAAVLYLLGSALTLVTAHPWRWLGGGFVGYVFLNAMRGLEVTVPLIDLVNSILGGRFGLLTLLTGVVGGRTLVSDAGTWMVATFAWLLASIAVFLWAARRQPEG
jgi:hypothetical protein